jgi:hypothetical protein
MTQAQIIHLHGLLDRDNPDSYIEAVSYLLGVAGSEEKVNDPQEALAYLVAFMHGLLDADKYSEAALLCWGLDRFDPRPRCVRKLWGCLQRYNKLLVIGHLSSSKTYAGTAFHLLDWERDPENTNIKIVSTTEGHAKNNSWSKLADFHNWSSIPLAGKVDAEILALNTLNRQAAIQLATVPQGPDSKARLQGFHPVPRKSTHPTFGKLTRVRAMLDEAEKIATGVWDGIDNMLGNEDAQGSVRVYGATNPEDKSTPFARRAEPPNGWEAYDPLAMEEWESKDGWHVLHFDARKCENIVENRIVFPGLITPEGYKNLKRRGANDANLYTFGYGWYPMASAEFNVVPPYILSDIKGAINFVGKVHNVASLDPAFAEGGDKAMMTAGRYGMASGWRDASDKLRKFESKKWVLQIDQQFQIQKGNSVDMAEDIIRICRKLHVRPEWFVLDATGPGTGLRDYLFKKFGEIMGTKWGEKSTEKKVLHEDKETADKLYAGLVSEMWFSFSKWAEFEYVKIAPMMDTTELFSQLTNRHYTEARGTLSKVEDKAEFKQRTGGQSPDEADSIIQLVHLCRMRGEDRAAMLGESVKPQPEGVWRGEDWAQLGRPNGEQLVSVVDRIDFVKFDE